MFPESFQIQLVRGKRPCPRAQEIESIVPFAPEEGWEFHDILYRNLAWCYSSLDEAVPLTSSEALAMSLSAAPLHRQPALELCARARQTPSAPAVLATSSRLRSEVEPDAT